MHIDLSKSLEEPSLEYTAGKILYAVDVNRPAHFWDAQDIREALPIWKEVIFYGTNTKYIKDAVSLLFFCKHLLQKIEKRDAGFKRFSAEAHS